MKLLFDQNLSPKLADRLADIFPGSSHVQSVGLDADLDVQIWEYSRVNDYVVVTKDEDFNNLSVIRGTPPKVIWLQIGNCTTQQVEDLFRERLTDINDFGNDFEVGTLVMS